MPSKHSGLSKYKLKKLASESLRNCIRLHFDSSLLFNNESYPSAFQLSVLAIEEFAKAKWVHHYIWSSEMNQGYPDEDFENKWLKLLYFHPEKQWAFVAREVYEYSSTFTDFIKRKKMEEKKQNSIYVGFPKVKGKIEVEGRISIPTRIKEKDAKQVISLVNQELVEVCEAIEHYDSCFECVPQMDEVFDYDIYRKLLSWPYRSGLKKRYRINA